MSETLYLIESRARTNYIFPGCSSVIFDIRPMLLRGFNKLQTKIIAPNVQQTAESTATVPRHPNR